MTQPRLTEPRLTLSPARNTEAWIAALAGFCLIWFRTHSIGISPDSVTYTSVARSLAGTGKPLEFDGEWLVDFPIGYPAFLGLILFITRSDPFHFGLVLNSLLFGLLVFFCMRQAKRNGQPFWLRCVYGLCLLGSISLLQVYGMLWSESLFILCVACFFIVCGRYGRNHGIGPLWGMAVATAIGCIIRYAGITLLATGLILLISDRRIGNRKKARHALIYTSAGISLLLVNLIVNRVHEGYLTGDRMLNHAPVAEHLKRFGATLLRWLYPSFPAAGEGFAALSIVCAILFILVPVAAVWYRWRRGRSLYTWASLGAIFVIVYSLFILGVALMTAFQPLDSRLLSPLCFPALGAAAGVAAAGVAAARGVAASGVPILAQKTRHAAWRRWATIGCVLLMTILLSYPGLARQARFISHPDQVYDDHIRYDFREVERSRTLDFVRSHPALFKSDKPVYSNAGEILYIFDTLQTGYPPRLNEVEEMEDFHSDSAYLIWLYPIHVYPDDYLPGLRKAAALKPLYDFPDGIIFSTK